ncbi:LLM class flavin-dependent oxidoreductase [Pantoea sp. App145]|uniref:LLM class flavin-dependent oxidoreductase n=1 Tax=Pantoea sp. App145 TaxID=3071567 RepID=UPI003A80858F
MAKRLIINAFSMAAVSHIYHGFWRNPATQATRFYELDVWVELAKRLESAHFDALFLADVLGVDAIYKGSADTYIEQAVQIPIHDASTIATALVAVTHQLGLVFTSSILQDHPFNFARRVSTLDHLSKGRVGWNIVTSVSDNASQNFGLPGITAHDERYRWAEEYMEVVYKLWEGSWDDEALLNDARNNRYADPTHIHRIQHQGDRYRVAGPHLALPSPQRTPVLYQAGSSRAGRAFASRHAEGTFIVCRNPEGARVLTSNMREQLRQSGRDAHDLKFMQGLSFVVGSTEEEAKRKARALDEYLSVDGLLAHISRDLGVDLGVMSPDQPLSEVKIDGVQGIIEYFSDAFDRTPTIADLASAYALNTRIVGTPEQIADELARWQAAGVDGINLMYETTPGSFIEFIDHVLPVLQQRGLAQREYSDGTLREKMFGIAPTLPEHHPARKWRHAFY